MATCSCDNLSISDCLDIPAGLTDLPRQYLGFGEFRHTLIQSIAQHPELAAWSAEGEQDLGVMLLEMWAYVLDITQFYDEKITEEFYLSSSKRRVSAERLVKILGYRPRPALSASVTLTVEAEGALAVTLPEGTGFRSEAFGDEPPQVFSALAPQEIRPERNGWTLKPIPGTDFPGKLLFTPREAGVPKTGILAFRMGDEAIHAGTIASVEGVTGPDGQRYQQVTLEEGTAPLDGKAVAGIRARLMGLSAGPTAFADGYAGGALILDGLYPQIRGRQLAVLELEDTLHAFIIPGGGVDKADVVVATTPELTDPEVEAQDITAPATRVALPEGFAPEPEADVEWRLHFNPIRVGRPAAPALTELALGQVTAGTALERPALPSLASQSGGFILQGMAPEGVEMNGQVVTDPVTRDVTFAPGTGNSAFPADLIAPYTLRGNLVTAIRGEKVTGEVLGSADSGSPSNRFKLKKKPVSWVEDGSAPDGLRPLLEVRVDGVLWSRVATLYTAGPEDRVFMLETDEDGATWVVFGGRQGRGAVPATGNGNVTATYYYGAGAAKPPPGTIRQVAKPVKGLGPVANPLPAEGGKDAEAQADLKVNAPAAALTLGRAVSVQDFAALARTYAGVLNVAAGWAWDPKRQRAIVSIWVIGDGGVDAEALESWLAQQAAPDTPIRVIPATPDPHMLTLSLQIDAAHPPDETRSAVEAALVDPETGLLAPRNLTIGGVLFRSPIIKAAQTVPGVAAVTALRLDGAELEWAKRIEAGHYPDFYDVTVC